MRLRDVSQVDGYDAVFLSPHVGDAPLGCAARLLNERQGRRLLVVVCGEPAESVPGTGWPAALERFKLDLLVLRLPLAEERDARYRRLAGLTLEQAGGDEGLASELAATLDELRRRARARDTYLPLGVGGHADHRLTLDAALRVFTPGEGRNVFLYEERPAALIPGLLRLRLGQLGASLPPGTGALDDVGRTRLLLHALRDGLTACSPASRREVVAALPALVRERRALRAWRPQRGLGLRLQPLLHTADEEGLLGARTAQQEWAAHRPPGAPTADRVERLAAAYARRLAPSTAHVERYWLLLPSGRGPLTP